MKTRFIKINHDGHLTVVEDVAQSNNLITDRNKFPLFVNDEGKFSVATEYRTTNDGMMLVNKYQDFGGDKFEYATNDVLEETATVGEFKNDISPKQEK